MRRHADIGLNKGGIPSRPEERPAHRTPGRNPRPLQRRPALPHGWAQSAGRDRHLLKYRALGRGGPTAKACRAGGRARAPGSHLSPRMGSYPADRRVPLAEKTVIGFTGIRTRPHLTAQTARTCIYGHLEGHHVNDPAVSHLETDDNVPGRDELGRAGVIRRFVRTITVRTKNVLCTTRW